MQLFSGAPNTAELNKFTEHLCMANSEHESILASGVSAWNAWREQNDHILPDLAGSDLSEAKLSQVNFWGANISGANLCGADLSHANLAGANFTGADLQRANLNWADLMAANFNVADLRQADLTYANLTNARLLDAFLFEGNPEHLEIFASGVEAWNAWRSENEGLVPDLTGANFYRRELHGIDLSGARLVRVNFENCWFNGADLGGANLSGARLTRSDLGGVHFGHADLSHAWLSMCSLPMADFTAANLTHATLHDVSANEAKFTGADLREADLWGADAFRADFTGANLEMANLLLANLAEANLSRARLCRANLDRASLSEANLTDADLTRASLQVATLVNTTLTGASLSETRVYGISAWGLNLDEVRDQSNLCITPFGDAEVTVDNLELAQFTYLLLNNEKIRDVLDTIARKGVLILGRFTPERKAVLDAVRNKLRQLDFVPIMFDFEGAKRKDFTETVKILGGMSRFIIADITMPKSSPLELSATVPDFMIPFVPIIWEGEEPFSMFSNLQNKYDWVLDVLEYKDAEQLIAVLDKAIIQPAIKKEAELLPRKSEATRKRRAQDYL